MARIGRLSVAKSPSPPSLPPEGPRWYETPAFRRIALAVGGVALAALCPVLPPPANLVCHAIVAAAPAISGALDAAQVPADAGVR